MKKVAESPKNGVVCRHKIVIGEKGLTEITDVNISQYSWEAIGTIEEIGDFISIEVLGSFSYIIPKRFFFDSKQLKNFLETANLYKQNALKTPQFSYLVSDVEAPHEI